MCAISPKRVLVDVRGAHSGPTLLCIAGVHGNEPGGVAAVERVSSELKKDLDNFRGRFVALYGNLPALEEDCRYIDEDLNRIWTDELISEARTETSEQTERSQLLPAISEVLASSDTVTLLDLHSTSGDGPPFVPYFSKDGPTLLGAYGVPHVASTSMSIRGTLAAYFGKQGIVSSVVEGGEHYAASTIDALEAIIWLYLDDARQLSGNLANVKHFGRLLQTMCAGLPKSVAISSEFAIEPTDNFEMLPGFKNFQRVEKDQVIARTAKGEVSVPESGWLLFPLYQPLGNVGFYLVTEH
ncbi:MAG: succinylglutamate desuccinylase/aspartoacylase family protein [Bdellovibrionota bacterium]